MEYPFTVGTSGHIDHGKTALVKMLTNIDCDKLEEEKRRGITIELGFAPLTLPCKKIISIVDVPGHERFIRNMAAGAAGIDAALFIIAANEGVMPQTKEHLDIIKLFGIRYGIIVLTKKDLADDETLEIAALEARELVAGTSLENAPIIPVSSVTGEGKDALLHEISSLVEKIPARKKEGAFFLPVDRVFTKKGFGSIVTGTLYQGAIKEGAEVEVMPKGALARVRSLQTHGEKTQAALAGQRTAVNLASNAEETIERGDCLCAKGAFTQTDCISAWLHVLPAAREGIKHWQRVRLHVGTTDVVARISLLRLENEEKKRLYAPESQGPIQILPETKITVCAGQHFIVRLYSPLITIGGGRILLANTQAVRSKFNRSRKAEIAEKLFHDNVEPLPLLIAIIYDKNIISMQELFELSQMEKNKFAEYAEKLSSPPLSPDSSENQYGIKEFSKTRYFISLPALTAVANKVKKMLQLFHENNPELSGTDGEKLYAAFDCIEKPNTISTADFKDFMVLIAKENIVTMDSSSGKAQYRLNNFTPHLNDKLKSLSQRIQEKITAAGFNLLTQEDIEASELIKSSKTITAADIKRALAYLKEQEELRIIDGGFLFSKDIRNKLLVEFAALADKNIDITVASLRDALGINRKYSLSMLDAADSLGFTERIGDKRVLKNINNLSK